MLLQCSMTARLHVMSKKIRKRRWKHLLTNIWISPPTTKGHSSVSTLARAREGVFIINCNGEMGGKAPHTQLPVCKPLRTAEHRAQPWVQATESSDTCEVGPCLQPATSQPPGCGRRFLRNAIQQEDLPEFQQDHKHARTHIHVYAHTHTRTALMHTYALH